MLAFRGSSCPKSTCSLPISPLDFCSCPGSPVHLFHALTPSLFLLKFSFCLLPSGFWPPAPICPQSAPSLLALLFPSGPPLLSHPCFPAAASLQPPGSQELPVFPWGLEVGKALHAARQRGSVNSGLHAAAQRWSVSRMWLVFICRLQCPTESQEGETALGSLSAWVMFVVDV